ncbi:hypothetical protein ACPPVO_44590 [Dactylosporangium sp. McL0621]|uniref:fascin domain-containing protein n=1 Tax=Dactylosporangium sp. McL0621 TaxID=3415678 RepID=UPI003CED22C5
MACSSDYYLRITADGGRMFKGQAPLTAVRPTQPVVAAPTGVVSLRARANNLFVSARDAGASSLQANAATAQSWEQFDRIDLGGGSIALRARINGRYVCAENAGAAALVASRTAVGPWETFKVIQNANGTVSLQAAANGRYVCAENAGAAPLIANRTAIGQWEQFDLL